MGDVWNTIPLGSGADPSILQEGHEKKNNQKKNPSPYQLSELAPVGFYFAYQKQLSFYDVFRLHINIR